LRLGCVQLVEEPLDIGLGHTAGLPGWG
jgi:hypothetical protein